MDSLPYIERLVRHPNDARGLAQVVALGGLASGAWWYLTKQKERNIDPTAELGVEVDAIDRDSKLCQIFLDLHRYQRLNPYLYDGALINADSLLLIETALMDKEAVPREEDGNRAYAHFKVCVERLIALQVDVHDNLGAKHAKLVQRRVKAAFKQVCLHLGNVLRMCGRYDEKQLMRQAEDEIDELLARRARGERRMTASERWEQMRRRAQKASDPAAPSRA